MKNALYAVNNKLTFGVRKFLNKLTAFDTISTFDTLSNCYTWGKNNYYQTGVTTGGTADVSSPTIVPASIGQKIVDIVNADNFTIMLDKSSYAWSWGYNNYGQLGNNTGGSGTDKSSPAVSVVGNYRFTKVKCGSYYSVAMDGNSYAWAWGYNSGGMLGDNSITMRSSPVSVIGGRQWSDYVVGQYTTIALDANSYAWAWGKDDLGQMGTGSGGARSSPVSVLGGRQYRLFPGSGLAYRTMALDPNGYAWTWGYHFYGEMGNNSASGSNSPVSVVGGKQFRRVSTGYFHTLALDLSSYCWAWGQNTNRALGDGTQTNRSSPVSVIVNNNKQWLAVWAANDTSFALDSDNLLWVWGSSGNGKYGGYTATNVSSPTQITQLPQIFSGNIYGRRFR